MGWWWRRRERNLSRKSWPLSWPSFARRQKGEECELRLQAAAAAEGRGTTDCLLSLDTKTLSGKWCRAATGWPTESFVYMPDVEPTPKRSACASRWVSMAPPVQFLKLSGSDSLVQNIGTHAQADALGGRNRSDRGTHSIFRRVDLKRPVCTLPRHRIMSTTGRLRSIASQGRGALFLKGPHCHQLEVAICSLQ
jgi:hypothetical protein